jgi:hypothetical protein
MIYLRSSLAPELPYNQRDEATAGVCAPSFSTA